jgi:hypothetical protein
MEIGVIYNRNSFPIKKVHYDYTSMSCKKKMFIQYYVRQCCKIAKSTVRGGGVYIDDSFIVDIVSSLFRSQNLFTLLHTTYPDLCFPLSDNESCGMTIPSACTKYYLPDLCEAYFGYSNGYMFFLSHSI